MHVHRQKMCEIGQRAYARGLIAGTEGNFSCRLHDTAVLCTPSGVCKGLLRPSDLCWIDLAGRARGRPSSEIAMHIALYRAEPAIRAVAHTHAPFATTFAMLGESLPDGIVPEAEAKLGPVALVPYETPGTAALGNAVAAFARGHVAAILQNHGVVTWGPDLETAYARMEMLESSCRVVYQARLIGTPQPIPPAKLDELRAALRSSASASGRSRSTAPT